MKIVPMTAGTVHKAKALVDLVFPHQTPRERLFFWAWERREQPAVRLVLALAGAVDIGDFWLALDDEGDVLGTVGLYRLRKDSDEAVWLNWYCVSPQARGQGVGALLLDFAIDKARKSSVRYLRLETGDDAIMAKAQDVYEGRGLQVYETRNWVFYQLIRRQLELT
jgi:GNAT superfamily N-acetyltransferase